MRRRYLFMLLESKGIWKGKRRYLFWQTSEAVLVRGVRMPVNSVIEDYFSHFSPNHEAISQSFPDQAAIWIPTRYAKIQLSPLAKFLGKSFLSRIRECSDCYICLLLDVSVPEISWLFHAFFLVPFNQSYSFMNFPLFFELSGRRNA